MKIVIGLLVLILSHALYAVEINDIKQFQWKNRLLVAWSQQPHKDYDQIMMMFSEKIDDRDMAVFIISQAKMATNLKQQMTPHFLQQLRKQFSREKGRYFLIGKDGGLKSYGQVLDLETIFTEIDRMPMRREEIKKQSNH